MQQGGSQKGSRTELWGKLSPKDYVGASISISYLHLFMPIYSVKF